MPNDFEATGCLFDWRQYIPSSLSAFQKGTSEYKAKRFTDNLLCAPDLLQTIFRTENNKQARYIVNQWVLSYINSIFNLFSHLHFPTAAKKVSNCYLEHLHFLWDKVTEEARGVTSHLPSYWTYFCAVLSEIAADAVSMLWAQVCMGFSMNMSEDADFYNK